MTKCIEKKLDGVCTRMLRAILNKSWKHHPSKKQPHGHLPSISKTIQIRWTRLAEHYKRSKEELISDVLLWTTLQGRVWRTCRKRWTIETNGERELRKSMLATQDDCDEDLSKGSPRDVLANVLNCNAVKVAFVEGNGHGDTSSNPGRGLLHFT